MQKKSSFGWIIIATSGLLLLVTGVYYSGLQGPFLLDDNVNILRINPIALQDLSFSSLRDAIFAAGKAYPHRGLARLSFALNYYFAGGEFNVLAFKLTNLVIHVLNALLVWFISHRLLARFAALRGLAETIAGRPWWHWAALLSALIWALHPLQLTAVLYVVQRMTSLSALFSLLGLAIWICGRERFEAGEKGGLTLMTGGLVGGVVLGMLSKEIGILLPYYILITELVFFRREALKPPAVRMLRGFFLLFAIVPALLAAGIIISNWDFILGPYQTRNFNLSERLLTETRILWMYLQLLFYPDAQSFGLFHDEFTISRGLLTPLSTALSLLAWMGVSVLAFIGLYRCRLFAFALLWYLIGQSIESTFIGLELFFEHRNYLPVMGIILVFSVYVFRGLMAISDKSILHLALPGLLILILSGVTFSRANIWQYQYTLIYIGVKNHPGSYRYQREFASVLSNLKDPDETQIFLHLQNAARLYPGEISSLFEMSRIINRRLYQAGVAPGNQAGTEAAVDVLNDPLPDTVPELQRYDALIDQEVRRRIKEEVLLNNATEIGRYAQSCLNTGNVVCDRMLGKVQVWIKGISESQFLNPLSRALSAFNYSQIVYAGGDEQAAVENINEAIRLAPKAVGYRFQKALLMLAMERLDEADRVLDDARPYLNWSGQARQSYDLVRSQINAARDARGEKNSSATTAPGG